MLDGNGRLAGEAAVPVPGRLAARQESGVAWMHAAGGLLFIAWDSPVEVFSVLRWQQGGWAQVEHEEARPLGVLQPALVGGRYVFFCAEEGLLAVDVERDTFYRIALPPCGQGRAPGSYALDEQGRLLWSDELAGDGGDADARFYLLERPPLLDARGGRAPE